MSARDRVASALDRAFNDIYVDILNDRYTVGQAKASLGIAYGDVIVDEFREWWNSDPEGGRI